MGISRIVEAAPAKAQQPAGIARVETTMTDVKHRIVETNGIRMHVAEDGAGPLVVLCHGFPESWYSWRHQLRGLAEAGFHVVAPDMRGYGQTDRPRSRSTHSCTWLATWWACSTLWARSRR